jgi:hypothetical protein
MTRTRLIVGLITSHRTYLTITKTRKGRPRPDPGCSATDDDDDDDMYEEYLKATFGCSIVSRSYKISGDNSSN